LKNLQKKGRIKKYVLIFCSLIIITASFCGCSALRDWFESNIGNIDKATPTAEPDSLNANYYGRSLLNDEEKEWYDNCKQQMLQMKLSISVPIHGDNADELHFEMSKIVKYVLYDHPEIFWYNMEYTSSYDTYSNIIDTIKISYLDKYTNEGMTEEESKKKIVEDKLAIEQKADGILTKAKKLNDEYQISKYLYEYIILNTEYKDEGFISNSLLGVMINGSAVCEGYTKAYIYLMNLCGLRSIYVSGTGAGIAHSWNLSNLNGQWYYSDVTWGDPITTDSGIDNINYCYLNVTEEEITRDHIINDLYEILPDSTAVECNYFVKENLFIDLDSLELMEKRIEEYVTKAISEGKSEIQLKFAYEDQLAMALEDISLYSMLEDSEYSFDSYAVSNNLKMRTLKYIFYYN